MDDRDTSQDLNVRLVMERPDRPTMEAWRARLESFDLVIDAQNDRSIDAHGRQQRIEQALGVGIEENLDDVSIVSGPSVQIGPPSARVHAYIPRKPKHF